MSTQQTRRDLSLALEAFYEDGQHTFWEIFDDTPRAALAALPVKPEAFGKIATNLVGANRRRLYARSIMLAQLLFEQMQSVQEKSALPRNGPGTH